MSDTCPLSRILILMRIFFRNKKFPGIVDLNGTLLNYVYNVKNVGLNVPARWIRGIVSLFLETGQV